MALSWLFVKLNYTLYHFPSLKGKKYFSSRLVFTQFEYDVLGQFVQSWEFRNLEWFFTLLII